jgi:hypothetical protein
MQHFSKVKTIWTGKGYGSQVQQTHEVISGQAEQ